MAYECLNKSPIVNVGQTFVTKFGNIRLISVYDNGSGKIGVKPIGLSEVIVNTEDYVLESFYDGLITVKTNFFTLAGNGAHFWVCGWIEEGPPMCDQVFKMQDQNGNPLNGSVSIGISSLTVLGTGTISLEQGVTYTADASFSDQPEQTVTFTACTGEIIFTFEVSSIGTLSCYSVPIGADIFINDVLKGITDLEDIQLAAGSYQVQLVKEGYDTVNKTVTIVLGVPGIVSELLTVNGVVPDKESVFPFSADITAYWENDTIRSCVSKIVKALGGKSAYLEDGTKIVVVL